MADLKSITLSTGETVAFVVDEHAGQNNAYRFEGSNSHSIYISPADLKNFSGIIPSDAKVITIEGASLGVEKPGRWDGVRKFFGHEYKYTSDLSNLTLPPGVTVLNLHFSGINDVSKLNLPEGLTDLSLYHNEISDVSQLKLPKSLKELSIGSNNLRELDGLNLPEGLTKLNLRGNKIVHLDHLKLPPGVTELDVANNDISNVKGYGLLDANKFPALNYIVLTDNPLHHRSIKYLVEMKRERLRIECTLDNRHDTLTYQKPTPAPTPPKPPQEPNLSTNDPKIILLAQKMEQALRRNFITREQLEQLKASINEVESALPKPDANAGKVLQKQ